MAAAFSLFMAGLKFQRVCHKALRLLIARAKLRTDNRRVVVQISYQGETYYFCSRAPQILRIPAKSATDSGTNPATHSGLNPASDSGVIPASLGAKRRWC